MLVGSCIAAVVGSRDVAASVAAAVAVVAWGVAGVSVFALGVATAKVSITTVMAGQWLLYQIV